jgi:CubicO group peptidase (beta-lactamase class C family)
VLSSAAMMNIADISAEEIAGLVGESGFSGVVSLASLEDDPSLDLAFGLADRSHRVPNTVETRFAMASGCKIFTAMAVGLLIQDGKLTLDTRLADCVRSHSFHFGSQVTIGQLLNHTSGIPDYFSEEMESDYGALWRDHPCYRMTSVRDFLPLFENAPMKALPGQGFLYCNAGFILLGLVVEELTGQNFRDVVMERVIRSSGMSRTGYFSMDALPDNTALGYLSSDEIDRRTNVYSVPSIGGADGGAFTTVADVRRFWTSLLSGRILAREWVDRFLSPSVWVSAEDESWHYGYGVWLQTLGGHWSASIVGGDPGVSMESQVWLSEGVILTVLSNVQHGASSIHQRLVERLNAS